jgi:hypothetical protein
MPKTHKCRFCGQIFISHQELSIHRRNFHQGQLLVKKHSCHLCLKEYVRKESLQLHIKSNHTAKKLRVFDCPYDCSSFFIHWNELSIHIKTHHSRTDNLQMFTKKTNILERALEVFQTDINHFDISSFEQLITHNKIMRETTNLLRQQVNNIDMIYWNCFVFLLF